MSIDYDPSPRSGGNYATDRTELLNALYDAVADSFETAWSATRTAGRTRTPEEIEQRRQAGLQRELAFTDQVFDAVSQAADQHPDLPVTLLLDVDETFVKKEVTIDGTMVDTVRPAFAPLVETLRQVCDGRLSVGLLTARAQSHLDEELDAPTYLREVRELVDPAYVISARDSSLAQDLAHSTGHFSNLPRERIMEICGPLLNPELDLQDESTIRNITTSRVGWIDAKLPIIRELVDSTPERAFVYVDDAQATAVIDPNYAPTLTPVHLSPSDSGFCRSW